MQQETWVLDAGNTRLKLAQAFSPQQLGLVQVLASEAELTAWAQHRSQHAKLQVGISDVRGLAPQTYQQLQALVQRLVCVSTQLQLPFVHSYQTPLTLGADRIAALAAARLFAPPAVPVAVIDAGTAITLDVLSANDVYEGGLIAPGISLRFKALNSYTGKLPLLQPDTSPEPTPLLGNSTHTCLLAGVQTGAVLQLEATLQACQVKYGPQLYVILTGGDAPLFEKRLKSTNFVAPNLVLQGIAALVLKQSDVH
jgi:type III pantothenate kinase